MVDYVAVPERIKDELELLTEKADELYLMALNWKSLVAGVRRGRARRRARNEAQAGCGSRVDVAIRVAVSWKTAGDRTQRQVPAARSRFLSHQLGVLRHHEPILR